MNDTAPNIIVIPAKVETPQEQEKKRHLRVAAYCRVSTDSEEQLSSYENQLAYYTEKIMKEPGWTMAGVFADEGITGTSTCKRKAFLRMIRQCRQGKIDMILAKSVSRFARNTVDTLNFTRELRGLGIPVIFEEQNINSIYPESEFLITLHGAFAQAESESTSSRVRWGKRQSMKSGRAIMQYKWLLGYEKGPDGKPAIVPEQAEIVRFIYDRYLAGDTLQGIKETLEAQRHLTAAGNTTWTTVNIRSILTNEKYCGDVLLQKTFIQDCISKKVIPNTGQLPKYLIQNHHEGIISRETFDAVQLEMARRRTQSSRTKKSAPTGRGKYSGKYVLSNLLFCGECGTAYRRCVWTQHGVKRPVWRCVSRLDYGKKFCTHSPTLDEEPLQQAILAAVNAAMADHDALARQLTAAMERELAPTLGESMSLADIDRALEELSGRFNSLLAEASANPEADYTERFRELSESTARLKEEKARLECVYRENQEVNQRLRTVSAALEHISAELTEWDEEIIHQLLEKVTVLSREKILVTFRDGREIEQYVAQPKRRKLA
ncbi:recombinase family protein [Pseudoflavonifractor phocaeensis]|uniref:recombinase family protein n=1 Tax=Pseudoflavonifractor phocaeensis TaxID=1870988 RepID=UPI0019589E53|nr:recombinase family protein [Pseudoflavonifractor phocaeensis]MBM6887818.1 recombinase family protein [Pseudoflavonifractor phocaeensis]